MLHKYIFVLAFTLFLSACGGGRGGDSSALELTTPAETGSMDITITGLSANQDANVQITGPDGYSQTLTQDTTLTGLVAGDYQLTAVTVSVNNVSFGASPDSQSVTVLANQTSNVSISYAAPMTSVGVITGFGSVFVNGTEFDTDEAEIETDDFEDAPESDLQIGMVVTVRGTVGADGADGKAASIEYQARAEGPVDAIDLAGNNLSVLGQVFFVDELTRFENTSFETLQIGDVVEISAFENESGQLIASRIEKEQPSSLVAPSSAPLASSSSMTELAPLMAAPCNAVLPAPSASATSTPNSRTSLTAASASSSVPGLCHAYVAAPAAAISAVDPSGVVTRVSAP